MFLDKELLERYVEAHEALAKAAEKQAKAQEAANKIHKDTLDFHKSQAGATAALEVALMRDLGFKTDKN